MQNLNKKIQSMYTIFNINSGKIEICDKLYNDIKDKTIVLRTDNEIVNCDSGICERINNIKIEIKNNYNDDSFLYFIKNNVTIAMDEKTYYLLNLENIIIKKGINIFVEIINKINN